MSKRSLIKTLEKEIAEMYAPVRRVLMHPETFEAIRREALPLEPSKLIFDIPIETDPYCPLGAVFFEAEGDPIPVLAVS